VTVETTEEGGHVGFLTAPFPGNNNWLPQHIIHYFESLPIKSTIITHLSVE
jgi:uncharacterized protein